MCPSVSVLIPTYNEERNIRRCLAAVDAQTYANIVEILVIDGRSADRTRSLAARNPRVRVLDNPRRLQAAALNIGLQAARGEIIVRVDGHCRLGPDYVERCVAALAATGAAMVGGAMHSTAAHSWLSRGIAAAMDSRLGAGPARFHNGDRSGWVDTVYLGAYRAGLARATGGYREDVGVNEDYEFALRLKPLGGIWLDRSIRSTYTPRADLPALGRQFYRYGLSRAATIRRHPRSVRVRQLVPPLLAAGLVSPWRRWVASTYLSTVIVRAALEARRDPRACPGFAVAAPVMHLSWAAGLLRGLVGEYSHRLVTPSGPLCAEAPARGLDAA
ncbi:MAG TPA: glycosyltransferase family 2 protein [Solirubrobacteraceae bacterium]